MFKQGAHHQVEKNVHNVKRVFQNTSNQSQALEKKIAKPSL